MEFKTKGFFFFKKHTQVVLMDVLLQEKEQGGQRWKRQSGCDVLTINTGLLLFTAACLHYWRKYVTFLLKEVFYI